MENNFMEIVTSCSTNSDSWQVILNKAKHFAIEKNKKVLIYDVINEYPQFITVPLKELSGFGLQKTIEIGRILPVLMDGSPVSISEIIRILKQILEDGRRTILLLPHFNKYFYEKDDVSLEIIAELCTINHKNIDVIIYVENIASIPEKIKENCTKIYEMNRLEYEKK